MTLTRNGTKLDLIPADEARTLHGLLRRRVERTPHGIAFREHDGERWRSFTWRETAAEIDRWRRGLTGERLNAGDRVAIMLPNCTAWVCFEQAALSLGLTVVPLYFQDNPEIQRHILRDSGCRLILLHDAEQWATLAHGRPRLAGLERVICLKTDGVAHTEEPLPVERWLLSAEGEALPASPDEPDALATIVYTSGTTGPPKGVMLSHRNILRNAEAVLERIPARTDDIFLSFLPLSHTFERTVGYYIPMMAGSTVAYARSIKDLGEDLRTIRPTVLVSVPRIYERVHAKTMEQLRTRSAPARILFGMAVRTGYRMFEAQQGRGRRTVRDSLMWPLLRRLVADKVMARLGGRIRVAVSGGAPIQEGIARFFIALGLPLLQGYGLTETAPVVSANRLENNLPASVGEPLPGVDCTFGPDGELLVRSPGLMLGYWNRPEDTAAAVDADGWLHTGDVAELRDGRIFIIGRLKEILVTSTGENVPPAPLEQRLEQHPLIDQAMAVGEGMPCVGAVLVLNPDAWREFAAGLGKDPEAPESLMDEEVRNAILEIAAETLHDQPAAAQVHRVHLTVEPWTIDNGLLTATLKLKRAEIERKLAAEIAAMYDGEEPDLA
jgi:long-chain acyl-CoA synthetase